MEPDQTKVFILGVKEFSIYYLANSDEIVSRLDLTSANEPHSRTSNPLESRSRGQTD